jgi:hypothetical protein
MHHSLKFPLALALAVTLVAAKPGGSAARVEGASRDAGWSFTTEDQDRPNLSYSDGKKIVFMVGCGHAFVIWAAYPDPTHRPKKADEKAGITIENGRSQINLAGIVQAGINEDLPPDTTYFFQSDLGNPHGSSATTGKAWQKREARLYDFLDSGQSLTVSAAGKAYVLPPIKIADWKARFQKIC